MKIPEKASSVLGKISVFGAIAGVLMVAAPTILFYIKLSKTELAAQDKEWISDTFSTYLLGCVIFAAVVVAFATASHFLQPNFKILRLLLILFSSILILIFSFLFRFISANDKLAITLHVEFISIGCSLVIQSGAYPDFRRKRK